jgi:hypothetical protein
MREHQSKARLHRRAMTPSPIAMDAIEAIIVRHQSAQETRSLNEMRKTVSISLGAANNLTNNDDNSFF